MKFRVKKEPSSQMSWVLKRQNTIMKTFRSISLKASEMDSFLKNWKLLNLTFKRNRKIGLL